MKYVIHEEILLFISDIEQMTDRKLNHSTTYPISTVKKYTRLLEIGHNLSSSDSATLPVARSDLGGERERYRAELPSVERHLLSLDVAECVLERDGMDLDDKYY